MLHGGYEEETDTVGPEVRYISHGDKMYCFGNIVSDRITK